MSTTLSLTVELNMNKGDGNLKKEEMAENRSVELLKRLQFNCLVLMDLGIYWGFWKWTGSSLSSRKTLDGAGRRGNRKERVCGKDCVGSCHSPG